MTLRALLPALVVIVLMQGCAQLPNLADRRPSVVLQDTGDTRLGKTIVPMVQAHAGTSGVFALPEGHDAFAARMLLADAAERTLDVQYYIWHKDMSGTLLLEALRRAADRGVRVRMLLDDNNSQGLEDTFAELDAHPNVEIRLFNPFIGRRSHLFGYLLDFSRLDRRMHNKSFTADNQATIVGGRNIGDEYFDAGHDHLFVDLDVLAIGPVVNDVSEDFDRYWASASSYPVHLLLPVLGPAAALRLHAAAAAVENDPASLAFTDALAKSTFVRELTAHRLPLRWAVVNMVSDDPAKGLGLAEDRDLLWARLKRVVKRPVHDLLLISPYFVPGTDGVDYLVGLARDGVRVTVLTNSLAATDVMAVHAGYAKRRRPLLEAGVALFEMQPGASHRAPFGSSGSTGSSASSLHAKTFTVDGEHVFIGSFNFDPRSQRLNTEMGFVIESAELAGMVSGSLNLQIAEQAYMLRLGKSGSVEWIDRSSGKDVVYDEEPGAGFWQRLGVRALSLLPIEPLL